MLARVFPDSGTLRRIREQRFDTGATGGSRGLRQTQQKRLRLETSSREAALMRDSPKVAEMVEVQVFHIVL